MTEKSLTPDFRDPAAAVLKRHWGYDTFRPLQRDIIQAVLDGKDTLGLMPTGGGKSLTFQVPAMMHEGMAVVVTPLISLMKDQTDRLKRQRIRAVALHSGMTGRERTIAREKITNGGAKFLYVSPERLANADFMNMLRRVSISMIVVDEAHCISQWGYDFRPSYLNISRLRKITGAPVLALTATATPEVADDICRSLEMKNPARFRKSFVRDNLSYIVRRTENKFNEMLHILLRTSGSAIVYVRSRRRSAEIAEWLRGSGINALCYHAGLDPLLKSERQNDWVHGTARVMVATNAFGMGIDKPDVRTVIHFDIPPGLEEYYQEAGRAGRDGHPAYAVLLCGDSDRGVLKRRVSEAFPARDVIAKIYERICNFLHISVGEGFDILKEFDIEKFCKTFGYQERQCRAALLLLGQAGYMEYIEEADRRSRVMILCDREELYHLRGLSHRSELVLARLLREYTGLFQEYVYINEWSLCRGLEIGESELYESLLELARMKVISFVPRSRLPLVYFPTSREEPKYLVIGKKIYEDRKNAMLRRTGAMEDYAFGARGCREERMLRYFGEQETSPCGRCDRCREERKGKRNCLGKPELARILLEGVGRCADGIEIHTVCDRLRPRGISRDEISDAVSWLAGEGYVRVSGTRLYPATTHLRTDNEDGGNKE